MRRVLRNRVSLILAGVSVLSALLLMECFSGRNNPLDPLNPDYVAPQITIDTSGANVGREDTISTDSATIIVTGNREVSVFRARIDSSDWSQWQTSGIFGYGSLTSGKHIVTIESKYDGWDDVVSDLVGFVVQNGTNSSKTLTAFSFCVLSPVRHPGIVSFGMTQCDKATSLEKYLPLPNDS